MKLLSRLKCFSVGCVMLICSLITCSAFGATMNVDRAGHTATLLQNGKVLVAGGSYYTSTYFSSAELYDPTTNEWTPTGSMITERASHTATLLKDGKVLVTGGRNSSGDGLRSAELYDPVTGTWKTAGTPYSSFIGHTATLLNDGKVLVAGAFVEVYDPNTGTNGTWTRVASMNYVRGGHTATLLANGKVLVTSGGTSETGCYNNMIAEVYDPDLNTWTNTQAQKTLVCVGGSATLLQNGKVLVVSGYWNAYTLLGTSVSQIYDPDTNTWVLVANPMKANFSFNAAVLLPNGNVFVVRSGNVFSPYVTGSSYIAIYDTNTGVWNHFSSIIAPRTGHTATLLPSGEVLLAGNGSSELFNPVSSSSSPSPSSALSSAASSSSSSTSQQQLESSSSSAPSSALSSTASSSSSSKSQQYPESSSSSSPSSALSSAASSDNSSKSQQQLESSSSSAPSSALSSTASSDSSSKSQQQLGSSSSTGALSSISDEFSSSQDTASSESAHESIVSAATQLQPLSHRQLSSFWNFIWGRDNGVLAQAGS